MSLSDDAFIEQFENRTLSPEYFNHRGHLRLAWLYLRRYPLAEAIDRVTQGIRLYATNLGATDKFQHTLTEAIVRIMAQRMEQGSAATLDDYLVANPDLVDDIQGVVGRYYSPELLQSPRARARFVDPDLVPLEAA